MEIRGVCKNATCGWTYNTTEDVTFARVLVLHTKVCKDGSFVLFNGTIMHLPNLGEFIWVNKVHSGGVYKLMRFETCIE